MSQSENTDNKALQGTASQQTCPACRGSGKAKDADGKQKPCTFCNGTGLRHKAGYSTK